MEFGCTESDNNHSIKQRDCLIKKNLDEGAVTNFKLKFVTAPSKFLVMVVRSKNQQNKNQEEYKPTAVIKSVKKSAHL